MKHSDSIATLAKNLKEVQKELKPLKKDTQGYNYKYADLVQVVVASVPILHKHGFSITQLPSYSVQDSTLETVLLHESGEFISSTMRLYLTKNDPQGLGSAITYARRQAWVSIIGMVAEEDDDDAEVVSVATEAQQRHLYSLATKHQNIENEHQFTELLQAFYDKPVTRHDILKKDVDDIKEFIEKGTIYG